MREQQQQQQQSQQQEQRQPLASVSTPTSMSAPSSPVASPSTSRRRRKAAFATSTKSRSQSPTPSSLGSRRRGLPTAPRSANSLCSIQDLAAAELEEFRREHLQFLHKQSCAAADQNSISVGNSSNNSNNSSSNRIGNSSTNNNNGSNNTSALTRPFPMACFKLVSQLPGNSNCMDCDKLHPQWATVSFGALLCLECAGHHRSLGVSTSTVRSLTMDHWKLHEILHMLEGGNAQLATFFRRHGLCATNFFSSSSVLTATNVVQVRYKTKAARFYRHQLSQHVQAVPLPYKFGRRQRQQQQQQQSEARSTKVRSLSPTRGASMTSSGNSDNGTTAAVTVTQQHRHLLTQTSNVNF